MKRGALNSYLVEAYVPNLDRLSAHAITATLEKAADMLTDLGARVEWRVAYAIYADETYIIVVAASDEDVARRWTEAADLRIDHLTEVAQITRGRGRCRGPPAAVTPLPGADVIDRMYLGGP